MSRTISTLRCCWTFSLLLLIAAPGRSDTQGASERPALRLTSLAFKNGSPIPMKYTCDGKDLSPPLKWSPPPKGTKCLVLTCEDPDAAPPAPWVHWLVYNIPTFRRRIERGYMQFTREAGTTTTEGVDLPDGPRQGKTDFGRTGYRGPCPPPGPPHHYFFKLYALDILLPLEPDLTAPVVRKAMEGHILAEGQLMGTYQRK